MSGIYDEPEDPFTRVSRWCDKLEKEILRLEKENKQLEKDLSGCIKLIARQEIEINRLEKIHEKNSSN